MSAPAEEGLGVLAPRRVDLAACGALLLFVLLPVALSAQRPGEPEIDKYSEEASRAMAAKDWEQASRSLEKLAALAPDVAEVQGNLGLAYYGQNRVFDAGQSFERALKLNPHMPKARVMLGLCDSELGRNEEAIKLLMPAFARTPDDPMARMIGLGLLRAYTALGDCDKGGQVSSQLLKRFPKDPEILFQVSRFYSDRSYRVMKDLIELPSDSPWVHYANAEVQESVSRYDAAIAEYRTVLKMAPQLPGVHFRIVKVALLRSQDPQSVDEAQHEFEQELAVAPQNSEAEYELGEICRHRAQFEQAAEHFSRAVRYHPEFEQAQIGLARSLISLGRNQEALDLLEKAAQLDPRDEIPHYLLASVYRSLGESGKSESEIAQFRKLHASKRGDANENSRSAVIGKVTRQTLDSEISPRP